MFDDNLIQEYTQWKQGNKDSFTWWNYVNMKADLDLALGFARFYCPDVVIAEDCFILKDRYREDTFQAWKKECQNKTEVEKMMNLYELADFFHIHTKADEHYDEKITVLGNILQFFWTMSFKERFPERNIVVSVFDDFDGEHFITVYQRNEHAERKEYVGK